MKGFITYTTYRMINDKPYICLFGRLENNQSFLTINKFQPYFYVRTKDSKKLKNVKLEKTNLKNFNDEPVTKVLVDEPAEVQKVRKTLSEKKIDYYETDLKPATRFLIDNNIKSTIDIDGEYEEEERIDRVYKEPDLKPTEFKPKLKVLSLDIETDSKAQDIYCISLYTENFKKVLIQSKKQLKNAINCKDEEDLLETFKEKVLELDPDIITGWHFIDFDLNVINKKFKHYNINFDIARDNSKVKLRIVNDFFRSSKADITGRQCLDGIHLLKSSFVKLDNYKLDTAAKHFLKEKKLITSENKGEELERLFKSNQQKLIDYNLKDAELVYKILEKSGVLNLTIQRSLFTGLTLDRVSGSIASLDSLYIRESKKQNIVCPAGKFAIKERPIIGAYVKQPKPGIYENVLVLDFKSLYPSIMRSLNIDPYSYVEKGKDVITAPNKAKFKHKDGIMPNIIQNLWDEREKVRKSKNELARYAIKIQMNSIWGAIGSPACRFFNPNIANAMTAYARFFIKHTAELIEKKGYKVIYADTDSCFVVSKAKNLKEADKIGEKLKDYINDYYPKFIKKEYNKKSYLEMEYEKCYSQLLMPKLRGKETGAKKRYAGLVNDKLEYTGLEQVRSDWTELAKKFQRELYMLIFNKKDPKTFIKKFIKDLESGKYDDLLVYRKSIRKNLEEYTKTTPPHIKAARKLKTMNTNLIEYVITEEGPEPIQDIKNKIDYKHYLDKQIKPIADSILTFFDTTFNEVLKNSKQSSLFSF